MGSSRLPIPATFYSIHFAQNVPLNMFYIGMVQFCQKYCILVYEFHELRSSNIKLKEQMFRSVYKLYMFVFFVFHR